MLWLGYVIDSMRMGLSNLNRNEGKRVSACWGGLFVFNIIELGIMNICTVLLYMFISMVIWKIIYTLKLY